MKKVLVVVLAAALALWAQTVTLPAAGATVWWWRQQLTLLSGLGSWLLMSLIMVLSVRPVWLERPLGGMDKVYRLHKWAGIGAIVLGLVHYGIDLSKDVLRLFFERGARMPREEWWLNMFRGVAKDMGEWSVWLLAGMLVITLWQRFPYRWWRPLHRLLAVVYVALAFHSVVLAPPGWWQQPAGWVMGAASAVGVWCALLSLAGRLGRARRHQGEVVAVQAHEAGVVEVTCRVQGGWSHRAGQFAFVTFDSVEGHHPFTLSNADAGNGELRFAIKALGDYTGQLAQRLRVGQAVQVEGPYGRFDFRTDRATEQVWVAAGIGATPFIAWLEALQQRPQQAPAVQLHYCVRNEGEAVFAERMKALCATLPSVTLHLHFSDANGPVPAQTLLQGVGRRASVWFCGPQGFGEAVRNAMGPLGLSPRRFHQELFQMR